MRIVGGVWGGRRIRTPAGRATRPTTDRVREAWMSAIAPELPEATVLDLFAGSGALGIEALSRGARHVTFVESAPPAVAALRANLDALGADPASYRVVKGDALRHLARIDRPAFDLAFADPPYRSGMAAAVVERFGARPFARLLCVEHAPDERFDAEPAWHRRYGDTALTFFRSEDD